MCYIVTYYIRWVTISSTYSMLYNRTCLYHLKQDHYDAIPLPQYQILLLFIEFAPVVPGWGRSEGHEAVHGASISAQPAGKYLFLLFLFLRL